jgi:hypothetical protein
MVFYFFHEKNVVGRDRTLAAGRGGVCGGGMGNLGENE